MSPTTLQIILIALAWAAYGAIHSLLASLALKGWIARRWPGALRSYRLTYNGLALLLLTPPLALLYAWRGEPLWMWQGGWAWLANGLSLLAVAGFISTLRAYDGAEFLGLRQWRDRQQHIEDQEQFRLSHLHRFVRHPWYSCGLVILWTRDMDPALLASAIAITLYFWAGSKLEERKLLAFHGEIYRDYMDRVPGLVPRPGRWLSAAEAQALNKKYRDAQRPGTESLPS